MRIHLGIARNERASIHSKRRTLIRQRTLRLEKESTRLLDVTAHAAGKSSTVQIASALDAQLAVTCRMRRKLRGSLRDSGQFIDDRLRIRGTQRRLHGPVV